MCGVYVRARGRADRRAVGWSCICVYVFVRIKYVLENFDDWIIKYIYMQMAGVRIRLDGADEKSKIEYAFGLSKCRYILKYSVFEPLFSVSFYIH